MIDYDAGKIFTKAIVNELIMRMIHTSDWHLGQYFFTKSRAAEHQTILSWFIQCIEQYNVDVLVVSGDVFDNASPPSYARELYNRFIVDLQKSGCQLVILGGNHDSVAVLNESKQLLSCLNTHVIAAASAQIEEQVIPLFDQDKNPIAILCAVPFLRPRDVISSQSGQSIEEKHNQLQQAITEHYHRLYQHAKALQCQLGLSLPIIATGHLATLGVSASSAERDIYIGTLNAYPLDDLPDFDYIALGHIHRAQCASKTKSAWYSGSPLALSFDELNQSKSVYLVEFEGSTLKEVKTLEVPVFQPMSLIKGDMADIEQQLLAFKSDEIQKPVWLDIEIISQEYLGDLQRQVQELVKDLPVEVLLLRRNKEQQQKMLVKQDKETLAELTINQVFERRLALEGFDSDEQQIQKNRLTQLFSQVADEIEAEHQATLSKKQDRQRMMKEKSQ